MPWLADWRSLDRLETGLTEKSRVLWSVRLPLGFGHGLYGAYEAVGIE